MFSILSLRYGMRGAHEIRLHMGDIIKNPSRVSGYGRLIGSNYANLDYARFFPGLQDVAGKALLVRLHCHQYWYKILVSFERTFNQKSFRVQVVSFNFKV